jgi:hypothetical protein
MLESLIERVAPKVAGSVWAHFPTAPERHDSGFVYYESAHLHAQAALASEDSEHIAEMALIVMSYENKGLRLEKAFGDKERQLEAKMRRRKGGASRATQLRALADPIWEPYEQRYRSLIEAGTGHAKAQAIVKAQMARDCFKLPYQRDVFPSDRTIAKRLKNSLNPA